MARQVWRHGCVDDAEKLRRQEDLDIDGLVPIVEQSAAAFKICKERIAAVRLALKEHLIDSD